MIFSKDPSLCESSVDGALYRNEGELCPVIIDPSLHIIQLDGASTTSSRFEGSGAR